MSHTKESTFCQMSMTNPHEKWCISKALYINVTNLCQHMFRYTFDKLTIKITKYTSYEVGNFSKVVPTIETTCHEK
jgi:hypothetical protein